MKVITNLSIIIYISLIINGCAAVKQIENTTKAIETCKFTLQSIEPSIKTNKAKISLSGIKGPSIDIVFDINVNVTNTIDMDLSMNKLDLTVYVDSKLVARSTTSKRLFIAVVQTEILPAKVFVEPVNATKSLVKKLKKKDVAYKVYGTFYFKIKKLEIPITIKLLDE